MEEWLEQYKSGKEVTLELNSVYGVTEENFDALVIKLEELFANDIKEALGEDTEEFASIWPPDMSPEEQKKNLKEQDGRIWFLKVRKVERCSLQDTMDSEPAQPVKPNEIL